MSLLSPRPGDFCWETTSTAGTFNTFALSGTRVADPSTGFTYDLFADYFADGELVYYVRSQTVSAGVRAIKEACIGIYHHGPNTIEPTIGISSSNMSPGSSTFVPITWGAGSQNVTCGIPGADVVTIRLMAQVLALAAAANRTALGLGSAAVLDVGTTANKVLQLDVSAKIPAVDGSQITGLPASPIPSGTKMLFYANAAPSGWTLDTSVDDKLIGLTKGSGAGGTAGATNDTGLGGWDQSFGLTVSNHTLTLSEVPAQLSTSLGSAGASNALISSTAAGHSHPITSALTWRPPRAYFIMATKN